MSGLFSLRHPARPPGGGVCFGEKFKKKSRELGCLGKIKCFMLGLRKEVHCFLWVFLFAGFFW